MHHLCHKPHVRQRERQDYANTGHCAEQRPPQGPRSLSTQAVGLLPAHVSSTGAACCKFPTFPITQFSTGVKIFSLWMSRDTVSQVVVSCLGSIGQACSGHLLRIPKPLLSSYVSQCLQFHFSMRGGLFFHLFRKNQSCVCVMFLLTSRVLLCCAFDGMGRAGPLCCLGAHGPGDLLSCHPCLDKITTTEDAT